MRSKGMRKVEEHQQYGVKSFVRQQLATSWRVGGLVVLSGLLVACSSTDMSNLFSSDPVGELKQEQFEQARQRPMPLAIGDQFSFDNPDVTWTVVAVEEDRILWKSSAGEDQETALNPLLPALSWSSNRRGTGTRLLSNQKGSLFPLDEGQDFSFTATVNTDRPPYAWEFDWLCTTGDPSEITTIAGSFRTQKIACGRDGKNELVFDYAPELGYYVQMEIQNPSGGESITRQLTSYKVAAFEKNQMQVAALMNEVKGDKVGGPETVVANPLPASAKVGMVSQDELASNPNFSLMSDDEIALQKIEMKQKDDQMIMKDEGAATQTVMVPKDTMMVKQDASVTVKQPGAFRVHLASYKKQVNVRRGWQIYKLQLKDAMDDLVMVEEQVNLGSKGVFHRLFAAGFTDKSKADAFCQRAKAAKLYCKSLR